MSFVAAFSLTFILSLSSPAFANSSGDVSAVLPAHAKDALNPEGPEIFSATDSIATDSLAVQDSIINNVLSSLEEESNLFLELVGLVAEDKNTQQDSIPDELNELVWNLYTDVSDDWGTQENVLNFVTSAFSEHTFDETGNWVSKSKTFYYSPYKGKLPDFKREDFFMPTNGTITSTYGYRPKYHREHHGIDIALNIGDTVRCALPGIVSGVGFDPNGYGNYVIIVHNGDLQTLYGHLQSVISFPGQKVKAGDPIATGGSTGNSTGPHLHFETRLRGKPLDPRTRFDFSGISR